MAKKKLKKSVGRKVAKAPAAKAAPGIMAKVGAAVGRKVGVTPAVRGVGFRRRRITPERLMRKILILRLQRKYQKLRFGGMR